MLVPEIEEVTPTHIIQTVQGLLFPALNRDTGLTTRPDIQTHQPATVQQRQARQKPDTKHPYRARPTSTRAPSVRRKKEDEKDVVGGEE